MWRSVSTGVRTLTSSSTNRSVGCDFCTLAPTLDKAAEKPIGASTGTNLDEHGHAPFSPISNRPIRRLYTQADLPADWNYDQYLGYPGQPPYTRGIHSTGYKR